MKTTYVAGESAHDLIRALRQFEPTPQNGGMIEITACLERGEAVPLQRALMRIEAELLAEDADRVGIDDKPPPRSSAQRRADALVELVRRLGEALAT